MKNKYAFTLIELMVAVAIIGILASLGFQQYQNYIIRNYVAEGLTISQPAKTAVNEFYSSRGALPQSNASVGLPLSSSIISANANPVKFVNINTSGDIEVHFGSKVSSTAVNLKLIPVITNGTLAWRCDRNNMKIQWMPDECRK